MKFKPALPVIKGILFVLGFIMMLPACKQDPADDRLLQMETIISKWESELRSRPAGFDDLVYIQTDITAYDVDEQSFENKYGTLSIKQQRRLADIRVRFKKLMRKDN